MPVPNKISMGFQFDLCGMERGEETTRLSYELTDKKSGVYMVFHIDIDNAVMPNDYQVETQSAEFVRAEMLGLIQDGLSMRQPTETAEDTAEKNG